LVYKRSSKQNSDLENQEHPGILASSIKMPDKYTNIESCGLARMIKIVVADGNIAIYQKTSSKACPATTYTICSPDKVACQ
jgi:hypothetical protein